MLGMLSSAVLRPVALRAVDGSPTGCCEFPAGCPLSKHCSVWADCSCTTVIGAQDS